jgi:NAD(P)-dependent dehydrogenase (short-subunit alcohol dehydrogenase family)
MSKPTYLVTGGTSGIGLATAQLLQSEGARVLVTGRNPETLAEARRTLGPEVVVLASDAASLEAARALGAEVARHAPRLDGAFLNAGVGRFTPIEGVTPEEFDWTFGINVRGLYFQLQSLLPALANPSSVVITSSVAAQIGLPNSSVYSASKAAVVSLGKTLAVELAPRGIRVNTISPGPVATPIFGKMGIPAEAQQGLREGLAQGTLVKRMGQPEEIARLARYLLSPESAFIVGEDILIDGGRRLA